MALYGKAEINNGRNYIKVMDDLLEVEFQMKAGDGYSEKNWKSFYMLEKRNRKIGC